jgi:predicted nucleotidyltransferase
METSNDTVNKISNYFKDKPIIKAYLFGSYSRDETDENSDIDILVELDYSYPIGLNFIGMKLDLEDILNRKVDLLSEKSLSIHIKSNVEQDKVLIYEK